MTDTNSKFRSAGEEVFKILTEHLLTEIEKITGTQYLNQIPPKYESAVINPTPYLVNL
jgi:hypothetical protein